MIKPTIWLNFISIFVHYRRMFYNLFILFFLRFGNVFKRWISHRKNYSEAWLINKTLSHQIAKDIAFICSFVTSFTYFNCFLNKVFITNMEWFIGKHILLWWKRIIRTAVLFLCETLFQYKIQNPLQYSILNNKQQLIRLLLVFALIGRLFISLCYKSVLLHFSMNKPFRFFFNSTMN